MTTSPQWQPPGGPVPPPPATRPWFKKKRFIIPAGVLLLAGIGGAFSDPADNATPKVAAATSSAPAAPSTAATPSTVATASAPATSAPASPTASPTPSPEPPPVDPYTERFGTFTTITEKGSGDSVIKLPAQAGLVTATHKGGSNFVIETLDASNQLDDLLVNEIGRYSGVVSYGLRAGDATMLKITADGSWSVTIAPITAAPVAASPLSGTGDAVYKYEGPASVAAITHKGDSNFAVLQSDGTWPNLLINEIGSYQGSVPLTAGPSLLLITADGAWTLTAS